MKKLIIFFVACISLVQSTYAATSALAESLLEYEAITSAIGTDPSFENIIPATEFIIDIRRITRELDIVGEVEYLILTRTPTVGSDEHKKHPHPIKYIATLNVAPNPGIGPNIITVLSIVKVSEQHHHHQD